MFETYFDESWDQHQQKILVIGGMTGHHAEWSKIEWPWNALLDKYEIEYYRASDSEFARGQFAKEPFRTGEIPTAPEQYQLLQKVREEFFEVITRGSVSGLAIGVPIQDFRLVADTPDKLEKFGGTPYYLCGHFAMLQMLRAEKYVLNSRELMTFTFDRQQQFDTEMKRVHASLETTECEFHSQVGSISFGDKKKFVPLQVADTLVYESRKYLERRIADPTIGPRPEMQRLMDKGKIFQITLCEKDSLEWYLQNSDGLS